MEKNKKNPINDYRKQITLLPKTKMLNYLSHSLAH